MLSQNVFAQGFLSLLIFAVPSLSSASLLNSLDSSKWFVWATVDERACGGSIYQESMIFYIDQQGNQLNVKDADGYEYTGTLNGQNLTWQGMFTEDEGSTNISVSATISDDWITMEGSSQFTFTPFVGFPCSGGSTFSGEREVEDTPIIEPEPQPIYAPLSSEWPLYLGGSGRDFASSVVVDGKGNIIVAGNTQGQSFSWGDGDDLRQQEGMFGSQFVVKFDDQGRYLWGRILQNSAFTTGLAVDFQHNILVMGLYDLVKLDPDGAVLWTHSLSDWGNQARLRDDASPYVGSGRRIGVDMLNRIIVGGRTVRPELAQGGYLTEHQGGYDGYIQVISPSGNRLWSTYIGGSNDETIEGIAVSPVSGTIYVVGNTSSMDWVSGGMSTDLKQFKQGGIPTSRIFGQTCFVAALNSEGEHIWSTYLGGSLLEQPPVFNDRIYLSDNCLAIDLDLTNTLNIVGLTRSVADDGAGWMPPLGEPSASMLRLEPSPDFHQDGFAVKMYDNGSELLWGTYLGRKGSHIVPLALQSTYAGDLFIVGVTSSEYWTVRGRDTVYNGERDGFWLHLTSAGHTRSSSYMGGLLDDEAWSIAFDKAENPIIVGITNSPFWQEGKASLRLNPDPYYRGDSDAFVVRLLPPSSRKPKPLPLWLPAILR